MRRNIEALVGPANIPHASAARTRRWRWRGVLGVVLGIGFAIYLLGLAYSPFPMAAADGRIDRAR